MDNVKKKRLKSYIAWICLAALVALLAVMPLLAQKEQEEEGPVASILEGTVRMGELETGLRGGGTLSAGNAENVTLPKGVKITEFLVSNGDLVKKGDPVAAVDKVSVMTAIVQVRETLEYIQEEMADAKDEKAASTISATAGGRVKQVFAQAGDSVQDVMLRHGALAVLSLDGMMALDLQVNTALAAGDSVAVTFGDGSSVSGRVESNLNGILVVTLEDQNYEVGEPATVATPDGKILGESVLYVHNAWKATAFTGTVNAVYAKENTDVYNGASLFTLKDTDFTGTLDSLASLHREYEELLQDLFAMYEAEVITAPCDGKISGVDTDSEFLLSGLSGEQGWFVDLLSTSPEEKGWTVLLLSNTEVTCTGDENCKAEQKNHVAGCPMQCTGKETCTAKDHEPGCAVYCTLLPDCGNLNHKTGCPGVCTGNESCQSTRSHEHHLKTCVKRCISDLDEDPATTCDAEVHQAACIENCTKSEDCTALTHKEGCWLHGVTYSAYAARVELVSREGLWVVYGTTLYQVTPEGDGWKLVTPDQLQTIVGETAPEPIVPEDLTAYQAGDILLLVTGTNSAGQTVRQEISLYRKAQTEQTPGLPGGFPGGLGSLSGLFAGMSGGMAGLYGGTAGTGFELYDLEGDIVMTVTEQDVMTLSITLDEQDIAKVSLGQTAQVKVNPLKGRTFEAEVTKIGGFGANNGGSSKFTVELTLPVEADMIAGMSATAYLPLPTKMDVLTIPVAALVEEGGRTLVYTARDPETGEPSAPVEVTTGLSDGISAEVLSGLESGATYVYSYYDTLELSTDVETEKYTFG